MPSQSPPPAPLPTVAATLQAAAAAPPPPMPPPQRAEDSRLQAPPPLQSGLPNGPADAQVPLKTAVQAAKSATTADLARPLSLSDLRAAQQSCARTFHQEASPEHLSGQI